jgi:hypothetical protein
VARVVSVESAIMMARYFCGLFLLTACASRPLVEREHLADGSWQLRCRTPMTRCVLEIDHVCGGADYEIVNGETRYRTYGIASLPSESSTSELVVRCAGAPMAIAPVASPASDAALTADGGALDVDAASGE